MPPKRKRPREGNKLAPCKRPAAALRGLCTKAEAPLGDVDEEVPFSSVPSETSELEVELEEQVGSPSGSPNRQFVVLPPGPKNMAQCLQWAEYFITRMCGVLGPAYVYDTLRNVHWEMHTPFSGMGCRRTPSACSDPVCARWALTSSCWNWTWAWALPGTRTRAAARSS